MSAITKVTIVIETTNASFEENFGQEYNHVLDQAKSIHGTKLYDTNGNAVGTVSLETEE